jgi:hypothetical protein
MFKKTILIFLLSISSVIAKAQEKIPFRITKHNNIIVKTLVNDKDSLDLMFQIAMENGSLSPERKRKTDHIIFNQDKISENNTVKIGKSVKKNISFIDNELTGHEADGKIGIGIFAGKTFKIDYDNSQFVIYDKMPDLKGYQSIPLFFDGQFYITGTNIMDDQKQELSFLLQSGYSGGILYSNEFSDGKGLDKKLKVTGEKTLKNSAGQSIITKQGVLPSLQLGDIILQNVSAGFFEGNLKIQKVNYFGADLLRRFNWIFDAERKTVYIKPSKYFFEAYYKIV